MKKMELKDAKPYEAPGHFDVSTLRLHDKEISGSEKLIVGVSHFLPGGGCEMGGSPPEKLYYVISGEITVKTASLVSDPLLNTLSVASTLINASVVGRLAAFQLKLPLLESPFAICFHIKPLSSDK